MALNLQKILSLKDEKEFSKVMEELKNLSTLGQDLLFDNENSLPNGFGIHATQEITSDVRVTFPPFNSESEGEIIFYYEDNVTLPGLNRENLSKEDLSRINRVLNACNDFMELINRTPGFNHTSTFTEAFNKLNRQYGSEAKADKQKSPSAESQPRPTSSNDTEELDYPGIYKFVQSSFYKDNTDKKTREEMRSIFYKLHSGQNVSSNDKDQFVQHLDKLLTRTSMKEFLEKMPHISATERSLISASYVQEQQNNDTPEKRINGIIHLYDQVQELSKMNSPASTISPEVLFSASQNTR